MKSTNFEQRRKRVRAKVKGTSLMPRISVFRSNRFVLVQIIDDSKGATLVSVSSKEKKIVEKKGSKTEKAFAVGELLAKRASTKKIKKVVFDKSGYKYHGIIKALSDGARKGGLNF